MMSLLRLSKLKLLTLFQCDLLNIEYSYFVDMTNQIYPDKLYLNKVSFLGIEDPICIYLNPVVLIHLKFIINMEIWFMIL